MTITLADVLAPNSDQLAGDDLLSGPRRITFTDVRLAKDGRSTKMILNYEGDNGKPFKPCKTMARAMVLAWGIADGRERDIIGKSVVVYRDPDVTFGADGAVGGVRISHMSHITRPASMKLTVSQGKKGMFTFQPLVADVSTVAITLEQARDDLEFCATLDDLKTCWSRKIMAPHREALADVLAECKTTLTEPEQGRDTSQMGEPSKPLTDHLFDFRNPEADLQLVYDAALADYPDERATLDEALRAARE